MPHVARQTISKGGKVGDEVKRAIEENRALLKEEREEESGVSRWTLVSYLVLD
jgi:hypothetical protein